MTEVTLDADFLLQFCDDMDKMLMALRQAAADSFNTEMDLQEIDLTKVSWRVGKWKTGRKAEDTDTRAWAFIYNQDKSIKPECEALLQAINNRGHYEKGEWKITTSANKQFFIRERRL